MYTEPIVLVGGLQGSFFASFALGYVVTTGSALAAYPMDTIRLVTSSFPDLSERQDLYAIIGFLDVA